jgi:hypothetical protein
LARDFSACLAGSRLMPPDSHLTYVGTDMCTRAARVRALKPAEVRRCRKSAAPPVLRSCAASTFRAWARRWSISGRGEELPSSQREIRSPPATSMRRANSCWVRPIRRRASRRATGSTPDSIRTNDTLRRQGRVDDRRLMRPAAEVATRSPPLACARRTANEVPQQHHRDSPSNRVGCSPRVFSGQHSWGCVKFETKRRQALPCLE